MNNKKLAPQLAEQSNINTKLRVSDIVAIIIHFILCVIIAISTISYHVYDKLTPIALIFDFAALAFVYYYYYFYPYKSETDKQYLLARRQGASYFSCSILALLAGIPPYSAIIAVISESGFINFDNDAGYNPYAKFAFLIYGVAPYLVLGLILINIIRVRKSNKRLRELSLKRNWRCLLEEQLFFLIAFLIFRSFWIQLDNIFPPCLALIAGEVVYLTCLAISTAYAKKHNRAPNEN